MARRKSMLQLKGFEEFLEKLNEAQKLTDKEIDDCWTKCSENLYDELYNKAKSAGLSNNLLEKMDEKYYRQQNVYSYEVGWKKQKPSKTNPLPDTYKVMFFNYGTPKRTTKAGYNRGEESSHPRGSHGFIKKAKLAAYRKNQKFYSDTLDKILKGLKK